MGILDQAMEQLSGASIGEIAERVGLTPQQVESIVGALGRANPKPGDTVGIAAADTGHSVDTVRSVLDHMGGTDALERIVGALSQGGGIGGVMSGMFSKG